MFAVIVNVGIEKNHPDHFHKLLEIVHKKANHAASHENPVVPEIGMDFKFSFQFRKALIVTDPEILAGKVVVKPGGFGT